MSELQARGGCQVWKDALSSKAEAPYLNHEVHGSLRNLAFCPYEDVLAAGHSAGISTVRIRSSHWLQTG